MKMTSRETSRCNSAPSSVYPLPLQVTAGTGEHKTFLSEFYKEVSVLPSHPSPKKEKRCAKKGRLRLIDLLSGQAVHPSSLSSGAISLTPSQNLPLLVFTFANLPSCSSKGENCLDGICFSPVRIVHAT